MSHPKQTTQRSSFEHLPDDALIRLQTLIAWSLVPYSISTLWRKVRAGEFPVPRRVSTQVTAWRVGDIRNWLTDPARFNATNKAGNNGGGRD